MKKKGFTLIELLAVIVILAIIALIATPTILGVIEKAKKGSFKNSVYGLIDSANLYVTEHLESSSLTFTCDGKSCSSKTGEKLSFKGSVPKSGNIIVDSKQKVSVETITDGTYCATGTLENLAVEKGCNNLDTTAPVIDENGVVLTSTTNSITVRITENFAKDSESGIKEYQVTVNGETKILKEIGTLTFTGLKKETEYSVEINVFNNKNLNNKLIKKIVTKNFDNPSITLTNTPTTAVDGYLKSQVAKITYNGTNISSPKYFVKTTREGTSSLAVTATCGTGTTPSTCTNVTSTKTLTANTWYQVSGNVNVTYNKAASATGTVYAITYDGTNYSGASTATISKIDTTSPTVTLGTVTSKTNSLVVNYTLADSESGVNTPTCKYGTTSGTYDKTGKATTTSCTMSGLTKGTTYYYQVCVSDKVGNTPTCKTGSSDSASMTNPSIALTNTPTTAVNGYLKSQVAKITYNGTNISSPKYFVKTTREGTSSLAVTATCGTGTTPSTCTNVTSTKTLTANTWYQVSGNVNVTYNKAASATGTVYAITYDGTNYSGASTATISKIDTTSPTVTLGTVTSKTNSLVVNYTLADSESGVNTPTCKYGTTSGSYTTNATSVSTTGCSITGLKTNTTYYYQVCVSNKVGISTCKTGSTKSSTMTNPSITLTNTPTTAVNGYLKSQVAKVTYNSSNITSPQYFVKTTREGTSSLAVTATCGTGTTPSTCTNVTSTKTLTANTWYQVSGNVSITYSKSASETGTVYAITYDGTNYSGASTATISKIDTTSPTFTVNSSTGGVGSSGTISIENVNEQESGIEGYYIGQVKPNSIGDNVTFGKSTSFTINASGTWYVAVKDNSGNMSKVQSVVYYSLTLNSDGATNYSTNSAFIKVGTSVNLPAGLVKSGYKADTWTGGISSIKIDKNISLTPNWYKLTTSLMDNNWSCNNNCKTGQSTYSISSSALTAQTWGNYNASWYINFSKTVNMTDFNYLQMNISATLYNRGTVRVYIDSTVIYIAQFNNISGVFINQNISSYTGNHTIKINFEQSNSGNSAGSTANSMTVTDVKLTN